MNTGHRPGQPPRRALPPAGRGRELELGLEPMDERGGGASVEAAIVALTLAVLIGFAFAVGRVAAAEAATDQAARSAARIASIARDPETGRSAATEEAGRVLAGQGLACDSLVVTTTIESAGLISPGDPRTAAAEVVRAVVTCSVRWSDLALPGAPGARPVVAEFVSPIDLYRERA